MTENRQTDGWELHRRQQAARWLKATPAQRLAALEELIELVRRTGVSPRRTARTEDGSRSQGG